MILTIIIAQAGEGKTFFSKRMYVYPDKPCLVFDINNEYYTDARLTDEKIKKMVSPRLSYSQIKSIANPKLSSDNKLPRSRFIGKISEADDDEKYMLDFLKVAVMKRKTNIIIDESTIFFEGRVSSKKIRALIGLRRHTYNNIVLNFLSVEDVPPYLLRNSNYIVLFKTSDTEDTFTPKSKFLKPYFTKVQKMPDHSYIIIPRNAKVEKPEIVAAVKTK